MTYTPEPWKIAVLTACMWGLIICSTWIIKRKLDRLEAKKIASEIERAKHEREIEQRASELYEQFLREVS